MADTLRQTTIYRNATLATMQGQDLGLIEHGALVTIGDRIEWVGPTSALPSYPDADVVDCEARVMTPGLVDCHTHLVYDGNRANEFEMRLQGASYEEIARAGGGIMSSVAATEAEYAVQKDAADELACAICETGVEAAESRMNTANSRAERARFNSLLKQGITTVEVKSGYGVRAETEAFLLDRARSHGERLPIDVVRTYLAAHVMPKDSGMTTGEWVEHLVRNDVDRVRELSGFDNIDMFCEGIAFSPDDLKPLLQKAKDLGVGIKVHADQLSDLGGARLAAEWGALSADHLEYSSEDGVRAMASAGTIAVMLPGAYYFIRETRKPPIDLFRMHGVMIAVATDHNPGTSPLNSLLLATNMAATLFGMTVVECLRGITINAARALGRADAIGSLEPGKQANLAIWDVGKPADLVYNIGGDPLWMRVYGGK